MVSPILETEGLGIGYEHPLVAGLDLRIEPGELLAILGPNGVGKSTLLKTVAGLCRPMAGVVRLGSRDLRRLAPRARARVMALMPQSLELPADVSVRTFVEAGRYPWRSRWRRSDVAGEAAVREALARTGCDQIQERSLHRISGGQVQRAVLARALAQRPRLLLVDEPNAALDPRSQIWLLEQLEALVGEGLAVLLVTHDLNLASQSARRVLLLAPDRAPQLGPVREVLDPARLEELYGRDFLHGRAWARAAREDRSWFVPWSGGGDQLT